MSAGWVWLAVGLAGCGASGSRGPASDPAPAPAPVSTPAPAPVAESAELVPGCMSAGGEVVTDFGALVAGERYRVVVRFTDPSGWAPRETLSMPMHHASRFEWRNLADFAALGSEAARAEELRFGFRMVERQLEHDAPRNTFFATYVAVVESVCSVSAPPARPRGALFGDLGPDASECAALDAAIGAAARELGSCAEDAECAILPVDVCAIEGLDCYWVAGSRRRSREALDAALVRRGESACPRSRCDCDRPPTLARCVEGRCAATLDR